MRQLFVIDPTHTGDEARPDEPCPREGCIGYRTDHEPIPTVVCPLCPPNKAYLINPAYMHHTGGEGPTACPFLEETNP